MFHSIVSQITPEITVLNVQGTTKLLGVIGDPVKHSLSPAMHNAAIAQLGADYIYLPLPVAPDALKAALDGFWAIGLEGFSITIPHKQAIMPLLEKITPEAQLVGAVNTVWRTETGWQGTNTDVVGFRAPLEGLNRDFSEIVPVVLGHGGAARAVVVACFQLGCPQVKVVGRNPDRLQKFAQSWQGSPFGDRLSVHGWSALSKLLPETELLVNSTPVGMWPQGEESPVSALEISQLPTRAIAYDLIYTPSPTQFLKLAQAHGCATIDGMEMLVQQGAVALEKWLGRSVPVDTMTQALREKLSQKS